MGITQPIPFPILVANMKQGLFIFDITNADQVKVDEYTALLKDSPFCKIEVSETEFKINLRPICK
jgi:hypothetical protein